MIPIDYPRIRSQLKRVGYYTPLVVLGGFSLVVQAQLSAPSQSLGTEGGSPIGGTVDPGAVFPVPAQSPPVQTVPQVAVPLPSQPVSVGQSVSPQSPFPSIVSPLAVPAIQSPVTPSLGTVSPATPTLAPLSAPPAPPLGVLAPLGQSRGSVSGLTSPNLNSGFPNAAQYQAPQTTPLWNAQVGWQPENVRALPLSVEQKGDQIFYHVGQARVPAHSGVIQRFGPQSQEVVYTATQLKTYANSEYNTLTTSVDQPLGLQARDIVGADGQRSGIEYFSPAVFYPDGSYEPPRLVKSEARIHIPSGDNTPRQAPFAYYDPYYNPGAYGVPTPEGYGADFSQGAMVYVQPFAHQQTQQNTAILDTYYYQNPKPSQGYSGTLMSPGPRLYESPTQGYGGYYYDPLGQDYSPGVGPPIQHGEPYRSGDSSFLDLDIPEDISAFDTASLEGGHPQEAFHDFSTRRLAKAAQKDTAQAYAYPYGYPLVYAAYPYGVNPEVYAPPNYTNSQYVLPTYTQPYYSGLPVQGSAANPQVPGYTFPAPGQTAVPGGFQSYPEPQLLQPFSVGTRPSPLGSSEPLNTSPFVSPAEAERRIEQTMSQSPPPNLINRSFGVEAGMTLLGPKLGVNYRIPETPVVLNGNVRGFRFRNIDADVDITEGSDRYRIDEGIDLNSFLAYAGGNFHPFGGGFHLSGGLGYANVGLETDVEYLLDDVLQSTSEVSVEGQGLAPYLGLGYDSSLFGQSHWSINVDAGAFWRRFDLSVSCNDSSDTSGFCANKTDDFSTELDGSSRIIPNLEVGLSYGF